MSEATAIVDERGIRAGKNSTGSTIVKDVFVAKSTTLDLVVLPASAGDAVYGATMGDIPTGYYGDIQVRGKVRVLAGTGGIAVGDRVMSDTAGHAVVATTGKYVAGICVLAAAANAVGEVELAGPGIGGKEP